jgi:uncharacterized repeat protein (TIGR01451 family)
MSRAARRPVLPLLALTLASALALTAPASAQITFEHVTIANNTASEAFGGLWLLGGLGEGATGVAENTLIGDNSAPEAPDCARDDFFVLDSQGVNLLSIDDPGEGFEICLTSPPNLVGTLEEPIDPRLMPLGDYGGETPTHALFGGSPAIDAAPDQGETEDQRGVSRPQGADWDIGAFEGGNADLTIAKSDGPDPAPRGGIVTYVVSVTNLGPLPATDVVIEDTLPAELTFQSATPSAGGMCVTPVVGASGGTVTCTFPGDLAVGGEPLTVEIVAGVPADAVPGSIVVNQAETSSATGDPDPDPSPNATEEETRISEAALSIEKTDSADPVNPGDLFSYTVTATNQGPDTAVDVVITDTLPAVLTFQSAAPSAGGSCMTPAVGSSGGTVTCLFAGGTPASTSRSVVIEVGVPLDAEPGAILVNQAEAVSETDTVAVETSEPTTIAAPVVLEMEEIPTAGELGLLALALMLAAAGALTLGKVGG